MPMVMGFVAILVMCYTLSSLLNRLGDTTAAGGAKRRRPRRARLVAANIALNYGFEVRGVTLWLINSGYVLVGLSSRAQSSAAGAGRPEGSAGAEWTTPTLTQRLAACYTGAVHDVLRMMGHDNIVLPPAIKAIAPGTRLAGPVWTVSGHIDRTKTRHETLLGWCTLLAHAPSGHVVVCQPHNHEVALMGELSAQTLQARGVLGYVVDGGSRDTDLVLEQALPGVLLVPDAVGHRRALDSRPLRRAGDDRHRHHPRPATTCWATATAW